MINYYSHLYSHLIASKTRAQRGSSLSGSFGNNGDRSSITLEFNGWFQWAMRSGLRQLDLAEKAKIPEPWVLAKARRTRSLRRLDPKKNAIPYCKIFFIAK